MSNDLFYATAEEAVFSAELKVESGKDFAAGLFRVRNNKAILASLGLSSAGWVTSFHIDVVDVSNEKAIFFVACAPASAKAPTSMSDFWRIPGRRLNSCSQTTAHCTVSPMMSKSLSYKVKGEEAEENPQAVLVIGIRLTSTTSSTETFHLGVRLGLRSNSPKAGTAAGADGVTTAT